MVQASPLSSTQVVLALGDDVDELECAPSSAVDCEATFALFFWCGEKYEKKNIRKSSCEFSSQATAGREGDLPSC